MLLSEFDFELPDELIAQQPLERRDASRMLVLNRADETITDSSFPSISKYLHTGDVLVINNTKVFPARLFGESETGAKVEVFLVEDLGTSRWAVLARPGKRLKPGKHIAFGPGLSAEVVEKERSGRVVLQFEHEGSFDSLIDSYGSTPLPPYIKRNPLDSDGDRERYQTLFASKRGAIAAPTAGLHFTDLVLDELREQGIQIVEVTLHVGYGTFEPVRVEDLNDHRVSPERFEISEDAALTLRDAKNQGRRIVAVGTTTTRALESSINPDGSFRTGPQVADLTILPGYEFKVVEALLTNFHLPKSSLLVLVSAFAGREAVLKAYRHAVGERYRFYSYGDCMLIS